MGWRHSVYSLEFMPEARDDLQSLDRPVAQRLLDKLGWLAENLDGLTPEPLSGRWKGVFKLRIGGYRVIYTINRTERRLTIHVVKHRREVYKME